MSNAYLHREDAPFGQQVWAKLDETIVGVAKARLAGRRLLPVDGPHGLALQSLSSAERALTDTVSDAVALRAPRLTPVPAIESAFSLSIREIAAFESTGQLLDLTAAARAAAACADQEDALVFNGMKTIGLEGLLTAHGVRVCKLTAWKEPGDAVENILQCVNALDGAGFHGPYALALAPPLYNTLFRCYPQGAQTELDYLRQVVTDGIVKAAALATGGVLVTAVKELAAIAIGQDLTTAFCGPSGRDYAFTVLETAVLRLADPASVCVLK